MSEFSYQQEYESAVKRKNFWTRVLWISVIAMVGFPLLGVLGTFIGMTRAFDTIDKTGMGDSEELSANISTALYTTLIGIIGAIIASPFLILALVKLHRMRKQAGLVVNE